MCGIVGKFFFNKDNRVLGSDIKKMTSSISHRGPDDEGVFIDRNLGLGHKRLSIIDLSSFGHQPMLDVDEKNCIVFNGEIYNFLELKQELELDGVKFISKTDTEVVLYLYKKYGIDCLKYLRGMFAFAIWDKDKQQLFLARDRVGKKPLKYYHDDNVFIFSSELKAILQNKEVKKEIDFEAIDEYLTYQYVPSPRTGFKNIYKLEPAHYMIIKNNGQIIKNRYWEIDYSEKLDFNIKEWEEIVTQKIKDSVKRRLVSDVPIGAHLSGGVDSSLVVAFMSQELNMAVKTFSIGFKEKSYNELPYARLVADMYKTDHSEFIIESDAIGVLGKLVYHYEEPYADSSALPTWYLCQITGQKVKVALNGDGGDENFAGYDRYKAFLLFEKIKLLPFKKQIECINRFLYKSTNLRTFRKVYRILESYEKKDIDFYLHLISYFRKDEKDLIYNKEFKDKVVNSRERSFLLDIFNKTNKFNNLDKILFTDLNSYLADDLLVKVDIASMANSLEVRSPFLDHELLELTAKMPSNFKIKGGITKYILKEIAYKYLPKECIDRPKKGFGVPLEYWFKEDLINILRENLLDDSFLKLGFNGDGISKMISDHKEKKANYANQLWALLFLRFWLKEWFD